MVKESKKVLMDNITQPPTTPPTPPPAGPPPVTTPPPSSGMPLQATPPPQHVSGKKPYTLFVIVGILVVLVAILAFLLPTLMRNKIEEPGNIAPTPVIEEATPTPSEEADVSEGLTLTITSPIDKSTVTTATVTISGTAAPLADVFVNDTEAKADSTGKFSVPVTLDEGENIIAVSANDADGNYAEKQITVIYEPAQ